MRKRFYDFGKSSKAFIAPSFKTETYRRSINTYNHKRIEEDKINVKMEDQKKDLLVP